MKNLDNATDEMLLKDFTHYQAVLKKIGSMENEPTTFAIVSLMLFDLATEMNKRNLKVITH